MVIGASGCCTGVGLGGSGCGCGCGSGFDGGFGGGSSVRNIKSTSLSYISLTRIMKLCCCALCLQKRKEERRLAAFNGPNSFDCFDLG